MQAKLVYITAPDAQVATAIARALLEKRLVACANILPKVESHYWWEGKIESVAEVLLLAKTQSGHEQAIIEAVKALHPYTVPCITFLPIEAGFPPFLQWIAEETKG